MATAAILAPSVNAGTSSTITPTTAAPVTVSLFTAAGGSLPSDLICTIEKQNSSTTWQATGLVLAVSANSVTGQSRSIVRIVEPGSYRIQKPASSVAVGVDSDS